MRHAAFACLLTIGFYASAQPASARPIDVVKESGWIRIAVYTKFAPFSYEEGGELKGIDVELGKALAKSLNVEPRFMRLMADESVGDDLRNAVWKGPLLGGDVADVMLHVPVDKGLKTRNSQVMILARYYTEEVAIANNGDQVKDLVTLLPFAQGKKIGAEIDTMSDFYLMSAFGGGLKENVVHYTTISEAMQGLKKGEIQSLMALRSQVAWVVGELGPPIHVANPPMPGLPLGGWDIGLAVKHDSRDLGYAVDETITKLRKTGEMKKIFAKFGVEYYASFQDLD